MAVTTTITSASNTLKGVKMAAPISQNIPNSVYTKTISFTVPAGTSTNGYYTGDTLKIPNVFPKNTELIGFWWKTSVTQGATLTLAPSVGAGTAFVSAANLTSTTMVRPTLVPGTASVNTIATAESDLNILLAGTTVGTSAATITLTFMLASIDGATADYTTYTV